MGHIKKLGLKGFRRFTNEIQFEFSPITILTGANSSGKSSIIKSLGLLKNNIANNDNFPFQLSFSEYGEVNHFLGDFGNVLSYNSAKSITISLETSIKSVTNRILANCMLNLTYLQDTEKKGKGILKEVSLVSIDKDKELYKIKLKPEESFQGEVFFNFDAILEITDFCFFSIDEKSDSDLYTDPIPLLVSAIRKGIISENKLHENIPDSIIYDEKYKNINFKNVQEDRVSTINYNQFSNLIYRLNFDERIRLFESLSIPSFFNNEGDFEVSTTNSLLKNPSSISDKTQVVNILNTIFSIEPIKIDLAKGIEDIRLNTWSIFENDFLHKKSLAHLMKKTKFDSIFSDHNGQLGLVTSFIKDSLEKFVQNSLLSALAPLREKNIRFISPTRATVERIYGQKATTNFGKLLDRFYEIREFEFNEPYIEFINYWLKRFNIADEIKVNKLVAENFDVVLVKGDRETSLADLGYGVSQLIPIILEIALHIKDKIHYDDGLVVAHTPSIMVIEEPEASLHPNFQSLLADLFIDAANKFGIQFIIETHSEYLIRKLQYWTARGVIEPQATKIFYFNLPETASFKKKKRKYNRIHKEMVRAINIKNNGSLDKPFGEGFFDEADNIAEDIFFYSQKKQNG